VASKVCIILGGTVRAGGLGTEVPQRPVHRVQGQSHDGELVWEVHPPKTGSEGSDSNCTVKFSTEFLIIDNI